MTTATRTTELRGVFDDEASELFTQYRLELTFRARVMGGTPKDAKIIQAWLRSKAGVEQEEELRIATMRTLAELGYELRPDATFEEMEAASEELAAIKNTNGFKRNEDGLYIEGRTIKAAMKESTNILYASDRWGKTKKGPKAFFSEHVFVDPDEISLGVSEPSGIDLFIGHTKGPQGPQSNLTYYEYVDRPKVTFILSVLEDAVTREQWANIWRHAEENGLAALRSQGNGRFKVTGFERLEA